MFHRRHYPIAVAAAALLASLVVFLSACGGGDKTGTPTPFSLGGDSQVLGFAPTPTAAPLEVTPNGPTPTATPTGATPTPTTDAPLPTGTLQIASVGNELRFDNDSFSVAAGTQIQVTLVNNATSAALQHNWVLVMAGTEDAVATAGLTAGPSNNWVTPNDPNVIVQTGLIDGGKSGAATFTVPPAGTYAFVCTFPGHAPTMRGVFEVAS